MTTLGELDPEPLNMLSLVLMALGLNHWICPCVESLGEFYWGDEDADDAGLPGLRFP